MILAQARIGSPAKPSEVFIVHSHEDKPVHTGNAAIWPSTNGAAEHRFQRRPCLFGPLAAESHSAARFGESYEVNRLEGHAVLGVSEKDHLLREAIYTASARGLEDDTNVDSAPSDTCGCERGCLDER